MKWTFLSAMACCVALFPAANSLGFLFENGSFDDPIDFEDGQGWERFGDPDGGAAIGRHDAANGAPGSPAYSQTGDDLYGLAFQTEQAVSGGFYYDVPVEAGRPYNFGIESHHGCNSFGTNGTHTSEALLTWYDADPDAGGSVISVITHSLTPGAPGGCDDGFPNAEINFDWNVWSFDGNVAPAGATYLRVTVQWDNQGFAAGGSAWVRWDNAVLTTTTDDINESQSVSEVLELNYETQNEVSYTVESSMDAQTWEGAGLPLVVGNDATQKVYMIPEAPVASFRLNGVR